MTPTNRKHHLAPKNGRYLVAMMVGAPADRARELRDRLAESRGMLVQYHLDYEKEKVFGIEQIPESVDLVIYIKSQLGHSKEARVDKAVTRWLREHGGKKIPVIKTTHKWASLDQALRVRFGIGATEPLPLEVTSTAYFKPPKAAVLEEAKADKAMDDKLAAAHHALMTPQPLVIAPPATPVATTSGPPMLEFTAEVTGDTATLLSKIPLDFPDDAPMKPSYETLQLIIHLQARMQKEGIQAMISPNEITISALKHHEKKA